jgi:hypothetical protein
VTITIKAASRRRLCLGLAVGVFAASTTFAQAPAPEVPVVAQAARTLGIKRCLSAVTAVGQRVSQGATHSDVIADWDRAAPDAGAFFSLTGLEFGAQSAALSLTTVPDATGGCSVLAERISAAPIACPLVAQRELPGWQGHRLLASIMVYSNPASARETVTLVNSAPGCLVIRRQVQYGWPAS